MTKILAYGNIKDGKLTIRSRKTFDEELKSLEGKEVTITVEKYSKKRSGKLNRYYWGGVVPLVVSRFVELGHNVGKEDVHEFLKTRFYYTEFTDVISGEIMKIPRSTSDMTNVEFLSYISNIQQFASEVLDIYIPDPNEQLKM